MRSDTSGTRRVVALASSSPHRRPRERDHRVARAAQESDVQLSCELPEPSRGIGAVHGRHRSEEAVPILGEARQGAKRQLAPLVVRPVAELREVRLGDEDVELARRGEQLERSRVDLRLVGDAPGVEWIPGCEVVRERLRERLRELVGERLERNPGSRGLVCEQCALTARLRDTGDARPTWPATPAEDLERLDELVEVVDLDRRIASKHRRERALGADERTRVRERCPSSRLRATDLEADDRLPGFGALPQCVDERLGSSHRLEEQPDRPRRSILREEGEEVRGVGDRLGPGRHDAAQPDAPAEREEGVGDRARLAQHCDVASGPSCPEGVRSTQPGPPGRRTPCSSARGAPRRAHALALRAGP